VLWLAAGIVQREFFDISLGLGRLSAAGERTVLCHASVRCRVRAGAHPARSGRSANQQCIGFFGFVGFFPAATKSVHFARVRMMRATGMSATCS
jgi:hypothetical protein